VHVITCRPILTGGVPLEEIIVEELGGQHCEASRMLTFALLFLHVMCCALHVGFLDDGNRLHGSTLPYITLVVDVFIFID
jgi:hypothetical protein